MTRLALTHLPLEGLRLITRHRQGDSRGSFSRLFCAEELALAGWNKPISQINHAVTPKVGTVRGMHFQHPPYSEMKLVTCLRGEVYDVAVDLRQGSPTLLSWHGEILSADNNKAMLIPEGFAHGFQALTDDVELLYCHSASYAATFEGGVPKTRHRMANADRDALGTRFRPLLINQLFFRYPGMNCRHCGSPLQYTFLDLGFAPPSNAYLTADDLRKPEVYYPLKVKVCDQCWLVQTEDYAQAEDLFRSDYAYFSSTSSSWLEHAARYAETMRQELEIGFLSLGIDPTKSAAEVMEKVGIRSCSNFSARLWGCSSA